MAAAARIKLLGQEALKVIDMFYTEKDQPVPNASTSINHFTRRPHSMEDVDVAVMNQVRDVLNAILYRTI